MPLIGQCAIVFSQKYSQHPKVVNNQTIDIFPLGLVKYKKQPNSLI